MAEWDHPRSMLRHIRGVGYAVVAPRATEYQPQKCPWFDPRGRASLAVAPILFFTLSFSTFCQVMEACIELERR